MEELFKLLIGSLALAVFVIYLVGYWKLFTKAGEPGFIIFIPLYNLYITAKIAGVSGWSLLLLLIPGINGIFYGVLLYKISKKFGKNISFSLGVAFFSPIFIPIFGFGDDVYIEKME